MRTRLFFTISFLAFLLAACNKDEEILIDNPGDAGSGLESFAVVEYLPAPGQFINESASGFHDVLTPGDALLYAQHRLKELNYVSLGAWGGFITVRSEKPIVNTGGYDFSIAGNAFDTSNEPGIVWVMKDMNANGKPDDDWYELKGSHYGLQGYERDYQVTYFRPESSKSDVRWEDNKGNSGQIDWVGTFHKQDFYYPEWIKEDSYTLKGSRLPDRSEQNPSTGFWSNAPFKWGYADNAGEDSAIIEINGMKVQKNFFRIADAVDAEGNPVELKDIDFIKVQTAVVGKSGILGENSTEICGFFRE